MYTRMNELSTQIKCCFEYVHQIELLTIKCDKMQYLNMDTRQASQYYAQTTLLLYALGNGPGSPIHRSNINTHCYKSFRTDCSLRENHRGSNSISNPIHYLSLGSTSCCREDGHRRIITFQYATLPLWGKYCTGEVAW